MNDKRHYTIPEIMVRRVENCSMICASGSKKKSGFFGGSGSSDRDEYSRGVKDGMNAHGRGGYNPGRNTSRRYQEGYRHGWSEDCESDY